MATGDQLVGVGELLAGEAAAAQVGQDEQT